jgi:hypothetical protein
VSKETYYSVKRDLRIRAMGAEQELRVRDDDAVRVGVQPLPGYESDSPKGDFYVTFPFESLMRLDRVCVQGLHSIKTHWQHISNTLATH